MWRGVSECEPMLDGETMIMAGHQYAKFVAYPIQPVDSQTGLQKTNFIAERRFDTTDLKEREDWNRQGKLDDFLPTFESFKFGWLDALAMIKSAKGIWAYPMIDRDPLERWTFGAMTLLGDAAHPMYPIGSNGASQAILDARTLTGCLIPQPQGFATRLTAIRKYSITCDVKDRFGQSPERPRVRDAVSRRSSADGFRSLDDVVSQQELQGIADRYKQLRDLLYKT